MNRLLHIAGISKQSFYKKLRLAHTDKSLKIAALISEADAIRKEHPGCGVEKIYDTLKPNWIGKNNGVIGRLILKKRELHQIILARKVELKRTLKTSE